MSNNQIKIPWYGKRVKRPKDLTFSPVTLEFPDRNKKPNNRKPNRPQPQPVPELKPEPVRVIEEIYNPDGTKETIYSDTQTPVPVIIPSLNRESKPLPTFDGKDKNNPTIPSLRERIPTRSPNPKTNLGVSPAITMPTGEILFKLMEIAPDGKYDNFLKDYNDLSLSVAWYAINPVFVFDRPTYDEVAEFFKTHDYKKIKDDDILDYFEKIGVSGKDLTTLPYRIFIFKSGLDTLNSLEEIFIPTIQPQNKLKQS